MVSVKSLQRDLYFPQVFVAMGIHPELKPGTSTLPTIPLFPPSCHTNPARNHQRQVRTWKPVAFFPVPEHQQSAWASQSAPQWWGFRTVFEDANWTLCLSYSKLEGVASLRPFKEDKVPTVTQGTHLLTLVISLFHSTVAMLSYWATTEVVLLFEGFFFKNLLHLFYVCMYVYMYGGYMCVCLHVYACLFICMCMPGHICWSQRTTCRVSSPDRQVLRVEHRSLDLAASSYAHWATLMAQDFFSAIPTPTSLPFFDLLFDECV